MAKKTVRDVDFLNKKVIMRVDFNVPMDKGVIQDDTRIQKALPTIEYILKQNPKYLILMSHLGDPAKDVKKAKAKAEKEGKDFDLESFLDGKNRMKPVSTHLAKLIHKDVKQAPAAFGPDVDKIVASLANGDVLMLENTRFHPEEKSKDEAERDKMGKALAAYADIFVNDAFGTAHRAHASTQAITKYLPSVGGFLIEKELEFLEDKVVKNPKHPFVAIIGGAKVSSKIGVVESLLQKVDKLIIGGGMAYTFFKVMGYEVGDSLMEEDQISVAKKAMETAKEKGIELILPVDILVADDFAKDANTKIVDADKIEAGWQGMDCGPKSIELYKKALLGAKTVFWNGPVGVFEWEAFSKGTTAIAKELANLKDCVTVIGGGDSVSAINKAGLADKMSHISTGGGASLELIEGKALPGIVSLDDK